MSLGAANDVTYTGNLTPANNTYRLGGGGATLTFAPVITGAASVIIGNAGSTGNVVLNNGNTYTGPTTIKGCVLALPLIANGNTASAIGASSNAAGNLVLDGGTLQYAGMTGGSTDRLFTLTANGGTIDSSGGGSLVFSSNAPFVAAGTGNRTLTLTGSAAGTITPAIIDPSSGITALTMSGTGIWTIASTSNSYSGNTTILTGTLQLGTAATLPNGPGKGNLIIATSGKMELTGQPLSINGLNDGPAGAITSDNPTGWASANGPGGGVLDNAVSLVTLTLGNNNAGGLFSGVISGGINLLKTGTGTQILSGDNTYSGTTTISAGTLQVGIGGTPGSHDRRRWRLHRKTRQWHHHQQRHPRF